MEFLTDLIFLDIFGLRNTRFDNQILHRFSILLKMREDLG